MGGRGGRRRGGIREAVANWRASGDPAAARLRLVLRNAWIRLRTRSDCCGRFGEPGC